MARSDRHPWDAPVDGDFARYVEQLSARPIQPSAQTQPHESHQRLSTPVPPLRDADTVVSARPSASVAALQTLRRLLVLAGIILVVASPMLSLPLWPLAFGLIAVWLALGHVAGRSKAAPRPARTQGFTAQALQGLLQTAEQRRRK